MTLPRKIVSAGIPAHSIVWEVDVYSLFCMYLFLVHIEVIRLLLSVSVYTITKRLLLTYYSSIVGHVTIYFPSASKLPNANDGLPT